MEILDIPVNEYLEPKSEKEDIVLRIRTDLDSVREIFEKQQEKAERCSRFYRPDGQWTDEELHEHRQQYRYAYQINECAQKVHNLIGTQTSTRVDTICRPRDIKGDSKIAELMSSCVKWAEQINDFEYTETEVFTDGIIKGAGAAVVRWEYSDMVYGFPRIERVPINELYWDANSKFLDLSDARWQARVIMMTKEDATEMYPEYAETISLSTEATISQTSTFFNTPTLRQREFGLNQFSRSTEGRRFVEVIEHYERAKLNQYVVYNGVNDEERAFDSQAEADEYASGLYEGYGDSAVDLFNPDGTEKIRQMAISKNVIIQTLVIGHEVVSREYLALPRFPYCVYFCYFDDGDYWSFMQYLIDYQILINRSFSQWDYQLGTSVKNMITVVRSFLPHSHRGDLELLRDELSKTSPLIDVMRHDAIQMHPNPSPTPALFENINFAIGSMERFVGGKNVLGQSEHAQESGRAVIARSEQAGIGRLPVFDHLRIWRKQIAEVLIWYIKNFMEPGQVIRVIGTSNEVQYVEMDNDLLDTMREGDFDIMIDEITKSESIRERQFQQLKELISIAPALQDVVMPMMIELSALPESRKQEILGRMESNIQYQKDKAQQQHQSTLQSQAQDSIDKANIKRQLQSQQQGGNNAGAPNSGGNTGDQDLPSPQQAHEMEGKKMQVELDAATQAQIAQKFGGGETPTSMNQLYNSVNTPEDMKNFQQASINGKLGITGM